MKLLTLLLFLLSFYFSLRLVFRHRPYCLTGAFLGDSPSQREITAFREKYGKQPFLVMIFTDWGKYPSEKVIRDIYSCGSTLLVTWEPWYAFEKQGIDYDRLLQGEWDEYIKKFAVVLKKIDRLVFLRFAHEMNGNWYPWSGAKIGSGKYISIYRYIKNIFDSVGVDNVKWIFSINAEDVPPENNRFLSYYPGDGYVDYLGIDGYNWGETRDWSRWMSFEDIFGKAYDTAINSVKKPVFISEFSSTSKGGDKAVWIKEAMDSIKRMKMVKAFVLFNVDKETDWNFPADRKCGRVFKERLNDPHFKENIP